MSMASWLGHAVEYVPNFLYTLHALYMYVRTAFTTYANTQSHLSLSYIPDCELFLLHRQVQELQAAADHAMMLKFGRIVDLDRLEGLHINKTAEDLRMKIEAVERRRAQAVLDLEVQCWKGGGFQMRKTLSSPQPPVSQHTVTPWYDHPASLSQTCTMLCMLALIAKKQ